MNTDYVSLETAKLLKEVGFNTKHVFVLYDGKKEILESYDISLWSAAKWLRKEHNIVILVDYEFIDDDTIEYTYKIRYYVDGGFDRAKDVWDFWKTISSFVGCGGSYSGTFVTYEQAIDNAIQEACKLIKNKQ